MGGLRRKTLQPVVHWPGAAEKMARPKAGFFPGRSSPLKFPLVARMSWRGLCSRGVRTGNMAIQGMDEPLFSWPLFGTGPGRWQWTHHTRPGGTGLYAQRHTRSASPHSSMRCPAEAWTQTDPTPLAVDTAVGPIAYARADRPDTGYLAHPRAPHGPQALPGPGDAWRAPGGCGIAPASPAASGWPGSRSAAASGSRAAGHAASVAAGILRPRASGCAGGGHVDNPCSERSPGHPPGPRAGGWRWRRDAYSGPGR